MLFVFLDCQLLNSNNRNSANSSTNAKSYSSRSSSLLPPGGIGKDRSPALESSNHDDLFDKFEDQIDPDVFESALTDLDHYSTNQIKSMNQSKSTNQIKPIEQSKQTNQIKSFEQLKPTNQIKQIDQLKQTTKSNIQTGTTNDDDLLLPPLSKKRMTESIANRSSSSSGATSLLDHLRNTLANSKQSNDDTCLSSLTFCSIKV